ncbi:MAG: type I polyketide synthase [Burkholderiales bacterium]|nr:type I polyketide synthase [Burkholderiales bacterium]
MPAAQVAGTGPELLVLSARSPAALRQAAGRLADHLDATPGIALADVAHTLQSGRREFEHRAALVVDTAETASRRLRADPWPIRSTAAAAPSPVWLFTGQGSQYPAMARALYRRQPVFRAALDHCATLLGDQIDGGLINLLCDEAAAGLDETARTQPALFAFEYALAQWWKSLAGLPRAMLGHSLGEYVAACVADVFDLETALRLVALRGRLMQAMPRGAMLAVNAAPDALAPWLRHDIGSPPSTHRRWWWWPGPPLPSRRSAPTSAPPAWHADRCGPRTASTACRCRPPPISSPRLDGDASSRRRCRSCPM